MRHPYVSIYLPLVEAKRDAHILLSNEEGGDGYEIVLGGAMDSLSFLRLGKQQHGVVEQVSPISWLKGTYNCCSYIRLKTY